jgi:hypothetical protein
MVFVAKPMGVVAPYARHQSHRDADVQRHVRAEDRQRRHLRAITRRPNTAPLLARPSWMSSRAMAARQPLQAIKNGSIETARGTDEEVVDVSVATGGGAMVKSAIFGPAVVRRRRRDNVPVASSTAM